MWTILKIIPFSIPLFATINLIFVEVLDRFFDGKFLVIKSYIFNSHTPFYYNYWIIYTLFAIALSMIFAFLKKYSTLEALSSILINTAVCVLLFLSILHRM